MIAEHDGNSTHRVGQRYRFKVSAADWVLNFGGGKFHAGRNVDSNLRVKDVAGLGTVDACFVHQGLTQADGVGRLSGEVDLNGGVAREQLQVVLRRETTGAFKTVRILKGITVIT